MVLAIHPPPRAAPKKIAFGDFLIASLGELLAAEKERLVLSVLVDGGLHHFQVRYDQLAELPLVEQLDVQTGRHTLAFLGGALATPFVNGLMKLAPVSRPARHPGTRALGPLLAVLAVLGWTGFGQALPPAGTASTAVRLAAASTPTAATPSHAIRLPGPESLRGKTLRSPHRGDWRARRTRHVAMGPAVGILDSFGFCSLGSTCQGFDFLSVEAVPSVALDRRRRQLRGECEQVSGLACVDTHSYRFPGSIARGGIGARFYFASRSLLVRLTGSITEAIPTLDIRTADTASGGGGELTIDTDWFGVEVAWEL